jgi:hypothetical protein
MSAWRRAAIEQLPEFRPLAERAFSPMALWIKLHAEFEGAYADGNREQMVRLLAFAKWCWRSNNPDVVNAVACAFFEHLPRHHGIRAMLPRLITAQEFAELREVFAYHIGEEQSRQLALEFQRAQS